jgi:hypothetical protein
MLPVLNKRETIAVLNTDTAKLVSAITFLAHSNPEVIFFLATQTVFKSLRMASILLSPFYHLCTTEGLGLRMISI